MREPLRDKNRLEHIVNAIDTILERAQELGYDDLTGDKIVFAGIVYYTMIIGEACYKLSPAFQEDLSPLREQITNLLTTTDWEQWERLSMIE